MKIPAVAWLTIGILIAVFSWIVRATAKNKGMILFFYIGILFAVVGIIKIIFQKNNETKSKKPAHHTPVHSNKELHAHNQRIQQNIPHYQTCFGCGTKHPLNMLYCSRCGTRLRGAQHGLR